MTEGTFGDAFSASDESGFDVFAPENVSPLVTWLCTPAAADISGQVFIVWGSEITVAQGWTPVAKIDAGGKAWTVDDLIDKGHELFAKRDPGVPPFMVDLPAAQ
jgi:3-oxoacyl-[acyl-carrier protein] reductase